MAPSSLVPATPLLISSWSQSSGMVMEAMANSSFGTFMVLAWAEMALSDAMAKIVSKVLVMERVFTRGFLHGKWYRASLVTYVAGRLRRRCDSDENRALHRLRGAIAAEPASRLRGRALGAHLRDAQLVPNHARFPNRRRLGRSGRRSGLADPAGARM